MPIEEKFGAKRFHLWGLHSNISIGMASDRYAGWIGQVYLNVALKREMSVLPNLSNAGFSMFYG